MVWNKFILLEVHKIMDGLPNVRVAFIHYYSYFDKSKWEEDLCFVCYETVSHILRKFLHMSTLGLEAHLKFIDGFSIEIISMILTVDLFDSGEILLHVFVLMFLWHNSFMFSSNARSSGIMSEMLSII